MKRRLRVSEMAKAKSWAHHLVQRDDWLVIDVETTGLGPTAEIVELALVGTRGNTLLDAVVRPRTSLVSAASQVHGLSTDILCSAASFEQIYGTLTAILTGRTAVAYNADFDHQALDYTSRIAGLPQIACVWDCAMVRYQQWRGFNASLATVCEIESIGAPGSRHRALPDAQVVWHLIRRMAGESS